MARWMSLACAILGLSVSACTTDNFSICGYTTQPNYNACYKTIHVPIFKNTTFRQGLEFDLTRAVIDQIHATTKMRVVNMDQPADTELTGTIMIATKNLLNRNQLNEIREGETVLGVALVWRDLKTGEILSQAKNRPPLLDTPGLPLQQMGPTIPGQPSVVPPPTGPTPPNEVVQLNPQPNGLGDGSPGTSVLPPDVPPIPGLPGGPPGPEPVIVVQSMGNYVPELGGSTATSYQKNVKRLATQIVSMMESAW